MYVARFETESGAWVQAAGELRCTAAPASSQAASWWDEVASQLSAATRIADATVTRRISLDSARRLRQVIALTAPERNESSVRAVFAGLTRLERLLGGSLDLPLTRAAHDQLLGGMPPLRFTPLDENYEAGDARVACNFRVSPALDDLLADAALAGRSLAYQLHARAYRADPEEVRLARKNALALSFATGARPSLIASQESLAKALASASTLAEEYLAVDTEEGAQTAAALLYERFCAQYSAAGLAGSPPRFVRDAHEDELAHAVHRYDIEPMSPVELSAAGLSPAQRDEMFAWRPSRRVETLLRPDDGIDMTPPDEPEPPPPPPLGQALPVPYDGDSGFAFVSYKREDLGRITPIMEDVIRLGVPIWYDRGIPGGAEWDSVIEDRLSRCRFVLLFASNAAVTSKYVRREVKYADAKDTPLLSVMIEATRLGHGLDMLLTQYQMLDVRAADFPERLGVAINALMKARPDRQLS